jgi:hypothetical protein
MSIVSIKSFNSRRKDKNHSEDRFGHDPVDFRSAWIIDGASPIHKNFNIVEQGDQTDATWISRAYDSYFKSHAATDFSPARHEDFFRAAIQSVSEIFWANARNKGKENLSRDYLPSATMAFMHVEETKLRIYSIGDCIALINIPYDDGNQLLVTPQTLPAAFKEQEEVRTTRKRAGADEKEIRDNRINVSGGMNNPGHPFEYWVLGVHPDAADHMVVTTREIPKDAETEILLISDGLEGILRTREKRPLELMEAAHSGHFNELAAELRNNHPDLDDDMGALFVKVSPQAYNSRNPGYTVHYEHIHNKQTNYYGPPPAHI